jgi:hypothetical protein
MASSESPKMSCMKYTKAITIISGVMLTPNNFYAVFLFPCTVIWKKGNFSLAWKSWRSWSCLCCWEFETKNAPRQYKEKSWNNQQFHL